MDDTHRILLRDAAREFGECNVEALVGAYKPVLDEFCAVSEQFRHSQPRYDEIFERLVAVLCEEYGIKRETVYVRLGNYGTNTWGNLYWRFLHLTSILLELAMHANRINDPLDFPLLVYNIDYILPCANCALHYRRIKESAGVKGTIKDMSFGMLMSGLQAFHNLLTSAINRTPEYANIPDRPYFSMTDFARAYKCVERVPSDLLKTNAYVRPRVDWQPNTHRMLSVFYAIATRRKYSPCSDALKLKLYSAEIAASVDRDATTLAATDSAESIMRTIDRAILMDVDEATASGNATVYNQTITEFYHTYPDYVRSLLSRLAADETVAEETRTRITDKIEKLLAVIVG